jgi:hypothetical protein
MNQLQCVFLSFTLTCGASVCHASTRVEKVSQFENVNNPRIMYWFWDPALLRQDKYLADLDSIAKRSPFDLVFLTARGGLDFYKYETMRPVFTKLLDEAHKRHIKIGLQLWEKSFRNVPTGKCFSTVEEQEVTLDDTGKGILNFTAKHIREKKAQQSMLFKAWAFKKKGDGIYLSGTLQDVTGRMTITTNKPGALTCSIDGGKQLAGYTVYALTKHDYPCGDIYSGYVSSLFKDAFDQYAKIPFDGTALDEYGIINVSPPWIMGKTDTLTERFYSPAMAAQYAKRYGMDMQSSLLTMRYVPDGHEKLRMKSINCYMDLMRNGPLQVEKNFYKDSESAFGHQIFHGVHGTHHNMLLGDELWHTGANWWTLPREYGQSDEITALPTEMGIAQCAQKNILYNMLEFRK